MEAEPLEDSQQILAQNIWELEQHIQGGRADATTRLILLRSHAAHVDAMEKELKIPAEHRATLQVNERTRDGVLMIHGSSGSPAQLRNLGDALVQAGFSVYNARLPGHGMPERPRLRTPWEACVNDAQSRSRVLSIWCQKIYVVGFSFGAAVALHLGESEEHRPRAMVLLAPALYPKTNPFVSLLLTLGLGKTQWVRRRLGWNVEVVDAMEAARKQTWWHSVPVLAVMADDDARISPKSIQAVRSHAKHTGTEVIRYRSGGHVFMDGPHRDELVAATLSFLRRN